ncbi:MAG: hypothetical protein IKB44_02150 [Clostridia bacterium]|nr:hypothetical protein [Clostridia bacterium]
MLKLQAFSVVCNADRTLRPYGGRENARSSRTVFAQINRCSRRSNKFC